MLVKISNKNTNEQDSTATPLVPSQTEQAQTETVRDGIQVDLSLPEQSLTDKFKITDTHITSHVTPRDPSKTEQAQRETVRD